MLFHILSNEDFCLCLSPGFYRFYGHIGVLQALKELQCLRPTHVTGSSAGALVGAFLASGMTPEQMADAVLKIKRIDVWDMGGIGGLLKGELFEKIIEDNLPVKEFEHCPIPFAVTTYDLLRFKTRCMTSGKIARAVRTSCTFPGLFQPVMIEGSPHIDGGVWDDSGMMALTELLQKQQQSSLNNKKQQQVSNIKLNKKRKVEEETPEDAVHDPIPHIAREGEKLIVNIVFDRSRVRSSYLAQELKRRKNSDGTQATTDAYRLITLCVENVPLVGPMNMDTKGIEAIKIARLAMLKALHSSHIQELDTDHWLCYVDAKGLAADDADPPLPGTFPKHERRLRKAYSSFSELSRLESSTANSVISSTIDYTEVNKQSNEEKHNKRRKNEEQSNGAVPAAVVLGPDIAHAGIIKVPSYSFISGSYTSLYHETLIPHEGFLTEEVIAMKNAEEEEVDMNDALTIDNEKNIISDAPQTETTVRSRASKKTKNKTEGNKKSPKKARKTPNKIKKQATGVDNQ